MVQKLKGPMRVYCRVKPIDCFRFYLPEHQDETQTLIPSPTDPLAGLSSCIQVSDILTGGQLPICLDLQNGKENLTFHFDGVFAPGAAQEDVFNEVRPFVQSSIDGENVCIFAYGQTGSGKTHTMEGPHSEVLFDKDMKVHELSGILPRTAIFILEEVTRLQSYIYDEIKVEISALEIYCDEVKDLFSDKIIDLMTDKNKVTQFHG